MQPSSEQQKTKYSGSAEIFKAEKDGSYEFV